MKVIQTLMEKIHFFVPIFWSYFQFDSQVCITSFSPYIFKLAIILVHAVILHTKMQFQNTKGNLRPRGPNYPF